MAKKRAKQPLLPGMEKQKPQTPPAMDTDRGGAETVCAGESGAKEFSGAQGVPDLHGKTVYLVDAHSLIHQVFHALPEMTSPTGLPVSAVYGFARDILFLLEEKRPDYLFCVFDSIGPTFRHEIYSAYKANRPPMHEDLIPQMSIIHNLIDALGLGRLSLSGYEADDIMATVARQVEQLGGDCFLVTSDKDSRQLLSEHIRIFNIRKNEVYDRESLRAEWGISPEQVIDFQSLVGDPTDNIPGIPLIGPKLASQLLVKHRTLEGVLEHVEEIPGEKRRENIKKFWHQALLSRQLVRLRTDVPIQVDWETGRTGRFDRQKALEILSELGFRSLAAKVAALPIGEPSRPARQKRLEIHCQIVDSDQKLQEVVALLQQQKLVCIDLETTHLWPRWAEIVGYALATEDQRAWYIPVRSPPGDVQLDPQLVLQRLRPLLENPGIEKIGQNLKYDMVVLRSAGVELAGVSFDTMLASYLLEPGSRNHNLDELARRYLGHSTIKISQLIGTGRQQKRMDEVPVARIAEYAGEDAVLPVVLRPILARRLAQEGLEQLFREVEIPLIGVLADMEFWGVRVDVDRLRQLSRQYGQRMEALEQEIYALAGRRFNINSPKQLQEVLFEQRGLQPLKRTKTGSSTDAEVLEELATQDPLPAKILQYRQYAKLKSTYVDALPEMVHPVTGRIHASFHQVVTATGRLSSSDPNLQNIPIRTEEGREIRSAFVPGQEGWQMVSADYSQIELRILAHYCGDERLCEAFRRDEDIHARVASQIFGVPLEEVTPEMRRRAKAVNFGVIYGQTAFGLSKQLGISPEEAAQFIDTYFGGYPRIEEFLRHTLAECHQAGYVKTILGRRRVIEGVRPEAGRQRNLAERTAINTVIQGSAADLIKLAMLGVWRRLRQEGLKSRMILQIHDELVFECPQEEVPQLAKLIESEMGGVWSLQVPLKVDVTVGPNWADLHPVETAGP
ncbi:MAG: DNA polymerase I [Thermoguttaceae bacterium]|nr:DNA polymerase I [Thermoguttaceae bacterium]MDW8037301.1 DNA polymerase I [Thermoguttaceae bacterium]